MLITFVLFLSILVAIIPGIRDKWFGVHMLVCLGASWLLEHHFGLVKTEAFSQHALTLVIIVHLFFINLLLFVIYGLDKRRAARGGWRVPERVLHGFTLAGGTLAAFVAQKTFRHKTKKKSFRNSFFGIVVFQITALILLYIITDVIAYRGGF